MALAVIGMGWSWSAFLAHNTLQDIVEAQDSPLSPEGRVSHGSYPPQFDKWELLHWLYVDDYAGACLAPVVRGSPDLAQAAAAPIANGPIVGLNAVPSV